MCATTPAFVAALALLMLKQRESRGVCLALVPVIAGLVLATGAEPSFDALGFTAAVAATVLRALKTVLQVSNMPLSDADSSPCHDVEMSQPDGWAWRVIALPVAPPLLSSDEVWLRHVQRDTQGVGCSL